MKTAVYANYKPTRYEGKGFLRNLKLPLANHNYCANYSTNKATTNTIQKTFSQNTYFIITAHIKLRCYHLLYYTNNCTNYPNDKCHSVYDFSVHIFCYSTASCIHLIESWWRYGFTLALIHSGLVITFPLDFSNHLSIIILSISTCLQDFIPYRLIPSDDGYAFHNTAYYFTSTEIKIKYYIPFNFVKGEYDVKFSWVWNMVAVLDY